MKVLPICLMLVAAGCGTTSPTDPNVHASGLLVVDNFQVTSSDDANGTWSMTVRGSVRNGSSSTMTGVGVTLTAFDINDQQRAQKSGKAILDQLPPVRIQLVSQSVTQHLVTWRVDVGGGAGEGSDLSRYSEFEQGGAPYGV